MDRHNKQYFGRPRAHLLDLQKQVVAGRAKNQRKIDTTTVLAQAIISKLPERDRTDIEKYMQLREDDFALAAMNLVLDWCLGSELSPHVLRKQLTELWGTEESYTGRYER
jgi:hypothetical protein